MSRCAALAAVALAAIAGNAQAAGGSSGLSAALAGGGKHATFAATLNGRSLSWKLLSAGPGRSAALVAGGHTIVLCRPCASRAGGRLTLPPAVPRLLGGNSALVRLQAGVTVLTGTLKTATAPTPGTPAQPARTAPSSGPAGSTWTATAAALRGQNGNRFEFVCPPNASAGAGPVWGGGTEYFTDTSAVCPAAVMTGDILLQAGGLVVIEIRPGQPSYAGATSNGITSQPSGAAPGSFVVVHDS